MIISMFLLIMCIVCVISWYIFLKNGIKEPQSYPGALPIIGHLHLLWGNSADHWELFKKLCKESLKRDGAISTHIGPITSYTVELKNKNINTQTKHASLRDTARRRTNGLREQEWQSSYLYKVSSVSLIFERILTDPDACLMVANTCLEKSSTYDYLKSWLGEGLITARLTTWKHHRKLLSPAFNQIVLDKFLNVFNQKSRELVKKMSVELDKGLFDHSFYLNQILLENIILTSLGIKDDYNILKNDYVAAIAQMIQISTELIVQNWMSLNFGYQYRQIKKKYNYTLKYLKNLSVKIIDIKKSDMMNDNWCSVKNAADLSELKFNAFLDKLLLIANENRYFSEKDIQEHVDTMILAGYETLANSLLFVILMIGSDSRVQDLIYRELQVVFGDSDRDVQREDLSKLVYLEAVIKESLRLYPVAPLVSRRLDKDIKLKNYTLKAGRDTMLFIYGIHRHHTWGEDAEEYRPERWLDPTKLPDIASAFATFSIGRRACIGKAYAMMVMKTTSSHLLRNYRIEADHTKVKLKLEIFLKPISGHHIAIKHRKKCKVN